MAQKILSGFGRQYQFGEIAFISNPHSFCFQELGVLPPIQDPTHVHFDPAREIVIGNKIISNSHLKILVDSEEVSRHQHLLSKTDVGTGDKTKDKMNTISTEKIYHPRVQELLENYIPGSEGTQLYLKMINNLFDAFIRPDKSSQERIFKAGFVLFVIRYWIFDLSTKNLSYESMITKHTWECIEVNTVFLLQTVLTGTSHLITMCGSQECDRSFRMFRSFTPLESTSINFSALELINKIRNIQALQTFMSLLQEEDFDMTIVLHMI